MDIKSLFKRLVGRGEDTSEPVQSDDYPLLYLDSQGHPSTGLDVQKVYLCLKAAENGDLVMQSDLFTDMEERDGHLFAELSKRKRALLTLPFAVKPPKDATEAEITLAAEAEGWVRNLPGLSEMLMDMLDAIGHGFSCIEIEWGQRSGLWMPVAFHKRPARAFTVAMYNHDDIRLNTGTNADGEPLWETGWIVHRHRSKSGPVAQSGLFRVLVWSYLFKNLSARDWAQFLNLYGLPFRIGKYDSTMDEKARSRLLQGIRMMARNGGGIIPKEAEIELKVPAPGQSAPFFAMVDWCEKVQSKAILGGTLTSQADGKTSTHALGNVHNEVRHDLLAGDARMVAETLTAQLLRPLLVLNGRYDAARMPRLEFDTREPVDLEILMKVVSGAQAIGMGIGQQWFSERSGIPIPGEGQVVLKPVSVQSPAGEATLSAAMQLRLAALSMPQASADAVQQQLDAAPLALAAQANQAAEAMLRPLLEKIRAASSPDAVYALLAEAYPDLQDTSLQELVGQAVFVADVMGQSHAGD